ncbi:MAG TPA: phosphoglucomutase (alpha-D-glucose-1,6-bisphosphate-dependent) [Rhodopila sp.]|nr:phosphoglucomutase (alpha-D-glucose-1,6-bisphosphate-dependent) [Rhodopila sp.]
MSERISSLAGKPAPQSLLVNTPRLVTSYFALAPDPAITAQRVLFGTSGHRGSAFASSFNEAHVLAITQAVCAYRRHAGIDGPLFLGIDTHALSEPAFATAIEVLAANGVETMLDAAGGYTPTPVISHAILRYNRARTHGLADGIVLSPSHNPPDQGGFKYNPPNGGPADIDVTDFIGRTANQILAAKLDGVVRIPYERARKRATCHAHDYITPYVDDLMNVVDMDAIRSADVRIGIDPLGGAAVQYWQPVIERYKIAATVVNDAVDPTFRFMAVDWDGKIRMDCSSRFAMTPLIALQDKFDIGFANDTDADRHGIVCPSGGLMNPNAYLATAVSYLCTNRPQWRSDSAIGKTVVSSGMIDRVAAKLGRKLVEVPVGFKWFSKGLIDGSLAFGGEESAGASFLRRDGSVWTTDKDGLIMGLLAAEMTARTGRDPNRLYASATQDLGESFYNRIDAPATREQRTLLADLDPVRVDAKDLAGEPIEAKLTRAPGNNAAIGGLKVVTRNGWFAARPSGTEAVYKIYAESFRSEEHLRQIQHDAQALVARVFSKTET